MTYIVGSARINERGTVSGGAQGDQKQTATPDYVGEVSMQEWYLHSKGWVVIRAKDPMMREKIATAMEHACNNRHIGYSQDIRWTAQDYCKYTLHNYDPALIDKDVSADCSALVRLCCTYAGYDPGDIYTSIMPAVFKKISAFEVIEDTAITNHPESQYRGDILCTRSSGHTVVVLQGGRSNVQGKYIYNGVCYDAEFDPAYYMKRYDDLFQAFLPVDKLLEHYAIFGKKEGRIAKETVTKKCYAVPTTDTNVRKNPSLSAAVVTVARKGVEYAILETREAEGRSWARIASGWMSLKYCNVIEK